MTSKHQRIIFLLRKGSRPTSSCFLEEEARILTRDVGAKYRAHLRTTIQPSPPRDADKLGNPSALCFVTLVSHRQSNGISHTPSESSLAAVVGVRLRDRQSPGQSRLRSKCRTPKARSNRSHRDSPVGNARQQLLPLLCFQPGCLEVAPKR
jgi:hypothetical protein